MQGLDGDRCLLKRLPLQQHALLVCSKFGMVGRPGWQPQPSATATAASAAALFLIPWPRWKAWVTAATRFFNDTVFVFRVAALGGLDGKHCLLTQLLRQGHFLSHLLAGRAGLDGNRCLHTQLAPQRKSHFLIQWLWWESWMVAAAFSSSA